MSQITYEDKVVGGPFPTNKWTSENANEVKTVVNTKKDVTYKVYSALLTQSGASAPTVVILENTLGGTITWTKIGVGQYRGTLTGAFVNNKTGVLIGTGQTSFSSEINYSNILAYRIDNNIIEIATYSYEYVSGGELGFHGQTDSILQSTFIEIRVYN